MGREANIPTWYATILLFLCGCLLAIIAASKARGRDPFYRHWLALAAIFIVLSVDEAAMLHETLGSMVGNYTNRFLTFGGWVGFGVVGMLAFGVLYLPFWLRLDRRTKWLFALAGVLFVGGAIGVESLSVPYEMGRPPAYRWAIQTTIEEFLELAGVAVFLAALVDHLQRLHPVAEFGRRSTNQRLE